MPAYILKRQGGLGAKEPQQRVDGWGSGRTPNEAGERVRYHPNPLCQRMVIIWVGSALPFCIRSRAPLFAQQATTKQNIVATQCCKTQQHSKTTTSTGRLPLQRDVRHVLCSTIPQGIV